MAELFQTPAAHLVLWIAAAAVLVAVGIYAISRARGGFRDDGTTASDLMTNFRELHSRGELSDREYRTIKAMLSDRIHDEIKDSGKEG
ncbi:MAG: hypothetical protein HYX69_13525 [Planctomycetia bacterium]|nr:hypothetical protein [Planctomycetia bacterium]